MAGVLQNSSGEIVTGSKTGDIHYRGDYSRAGLRLEGYTQIAIPYSGPSGEQLACYYSGRPLQDRQRWTNICQRVSVSLRHLEKNPPRIGLLSTKGSSSNPRNFRLDEIAGSEVAAALSGACGAFTVVVETPDGLWLVRDAAGERPLYYKASVNPNPSLHFSSRLRSLTANGKTAGGLTAGERQPVLDETAFIQYLTYAYVPSFRTLYKGIFKIPPGCLLYFPKHPDAFRGMPADEAGERLPLYLWYFPGHASFGLSEDNPHAISAPGDAKGPVTGNANSSNEAFVTARKQIRAAVEDAVSGRYAAWSGNGNARDAGLFLSGGLDSSIVCALLAKNYGGGNLHSFSINFGRRYPGEEEFARLVARSCGTIHHDFTITRKAYMAAAEEMVEALDEPVGDPITIPNYMLGHFASGYSDAVFNGEGGDPLFGGPKNIPMVLSQLYAPPQNTAGYYLRSYKKLYELLPSILDPDRFPLDKIEAAARAPLAPFFSAPAEAGGLVLPVSSPSSLLTRLMQANTMLKGGQNILIKVFHTYTAAGLEPFSPLFDRRLIDAAFAVPPQWKLHGRTEKHLLKAAVADLLPKVIIQREKSGMRVPVHQWMEPQLKKYIGRYLSPEALTAQGLFRPETGNLLRESQRAGMRWDGHQGAKIWLLIYFQMWYERVFRGQI